MTELLTLPPVWIPHPRRSPERAAEIARAFGAPLPFANALVNRGHATVESARRFLEPELEDLHDPSTMLGLDRGAERILAAIAAGERILVQGDYDVDGITSTFLLYRTLLDLGARAEYRIPHRLKDGYGLTRAAIDEARTRGCALVVTVDCGITANDAIAYAGTLGLDVVITDHHEPHAELPPAYAVINPLQPGCPYPFKSLAGVGVTFKLVERLLAGRGGIDRARDDLDVVALGTIADVVPLVGENRVLARLGLDRLNQGKRLGLRALIDVAGLAGRRIHSGHVAFVLAPRINAAGRMGSAEQGLGLLLARDGGEARQFAESLEEENERRRRYDEAALVEATRRVQQELDTSHCRSILLWSETWHPGVIGIVASRLVERFQRPALLIALDGDRGRGSGRSVPGLDLTRVLEGCRDLLVTYGGHAFAAGLTVERQNLQALRERFESLTDTMLGAGDFAPRLEIDAELTVSECDLDLVEWLERMAPHGLDNPEPLFLLRDVRAERVSVVGGGKHLRFTARDATGAVEVIGFGLGAQAPLVQKAAALELAFAPQRNEWLGETRMQLKLKALRAG